MILFHPIVKESAATLQYIKVLGQNDKLQKHSLGNNKERKVVKELQFLDAQTSHDLIIVTH